MFKIIHYILLLSAETLTMAARGGKSSFLCPSSKNNKQVRSNMVEQTQQKRQMRATEKHAERGCLPDSSVEVNRGSSNGKERNKKKEKGLITGIPLIKTLRPLGKLR